MEITGLHILPECLIRARQISVRLRHGHAWTQAIVSTGYWRRLGGRSSLEKKILNLDGRDYEISGVLLSDQEIEGSYDLNGPEVFVQVGFPVRFLGLACAIATGYTFPARFYGVHSTSGSVLVGSAVLLLVPALLRSHWRRATPPCNIPPSPFAESNSLASRQDCYHSENAHHS